MGYPIPVAIVDILRGHRQKETRFSICKSKELTCVVTQQAYCPGRGRVDPTVSHASGDPPQLCHRSLSFLLYITPLCQCMAPLSCLLHSLLGHFSTQLSNTGALQESILVPLLILDALLILI